MHRGKLCRHRAAHIGARRRRTGRLVGGVPARRPFQPKITDQRAPKPVFVRPTAGAASTVHVKAKVIAYARGYLNEGKWKPGFKRARPQTARQPAPTARPAAPARTRPYYIVKPTWGGRPVLLRRGTVNARLRSGAGVGRFK